MKITHARSLLLVSSMFLTIWASESFARKELEPSKNLLAAIHEMDVQPGDTLIDQDGKRLIVKGFAKNHLIATEQGKWVRSLSKMAIVKGSRGGFKVGDLVYDEKKRTGKVLGFYADDTLAWNGKGKMRIAVKKLKHLEMNAGPSLSEQDCQRTK